MRFPQDIPFFAIASFLLLRIALSSQTCYYASGQVALDDIPCPESNHCCPSGDTCMSNGLCRDINNFNDGANATLPDGKTYNMTGLYSAGSCQSSNIEDCSLSCANTSQSSDPYIWSCNKELTSYCCHAAGTSLVPQFDCCQNATFSLPSPIALAVVYSSSTSFLSSATSTAPASATTTSSPSSVKSTIPGGAIAGIVIGALAVIFCGIGIMYWILRCKRRSAYLAKKHLSIQDAAYRPNSVYEMAGSGKEPARELDCQEMPVELPSSKPLGGLTQCE